MLLYYIRGSKKLRKGLTMHIMRSLFLGSMVIFGLAACSIDPSDLVDFDDWDLLEGVDQSYASNSVINSRSEKGNGDVAFSTDYGEITVTLAKNVYLGDDLARQAIVLDNDSPIISALRESGTFVDSHVLSLIVFDHGDDNDYDSDYDDDNDEEIIALAYQTGPATLDTLQSQIPGVQAHSGDFRLDGLYYHYIGIINNTSINNNGFDGFITVSNGDVTGQLGNISINQGSYDVASGLFSGVAALNGVIGDFEAVSGMNGATPHTNGTAYGSNQNGAWVGAFGQ